VSTEGLVRQHFERLMAATGMTGVALARQVHEADVRSHADVRPGLTVAAPCDGHATDSAGLLLTVTVADCVPVFMVAPENRAVALVHAGWRGAAAGVLERGLALLGDGLGVQTEEVHLHLGPSICGECYEVGPEVFEALDAPVPAGPGPIDLRGLLARRGVAAGVSMERITRSTHCTRCTSSGLFSHRGGDGARQVGYMGIRP
jgi:YfiH family protein